MVKFEVRTDNNLSGCNSWFFRTYRVDVSKTPALALSREMQVMLGC